MKNYIFNVYKLHRIDNEIIKLKNILHSLDGNKDSNHFISFFVKVSMVKIEREKGKHSLKEDDLLSRSTKKAKGEEDSSLPIDDAKEDITKKPNSQSEVLRIHSKETQLPIIANSDMEMIKKDNGTPNPVDPLIEGSNR